MEIREQNETIEQRVYDLISNQAGREVDRESDLEQLGIDSLGIIELGMNMEEEFGIKLNMEEIYPTDIRSRVSELHSPKPTTNLAHYVAEEVLGQALYTPEEMEQAVAEELFCRRKRLTEKLSAKTIRRVIQELDLTPLHSCQERGEIVTGWDLVSYAQTYENQEWTAQLAQMENEDIYAETWPNSKP